MLRGFLRRLKSAGESLLERILGSNEDAARPPESEDSEEVAAVSTPEGQTSLKPLEAVSASPPDPPDPKAWTSYPDEVFRALRKEEWFKDNSVTAEAFMPDKNTEARRQKKNLEPGVETSVNWADDAGAEDKSFENPEQCVAGVARVQLVNVREQLAKHPDIFPERDRLPSNDYHGNLVFSPGMGMQRRKQLSTLFALWAVHLPPRKKTGGQG